MAEITMCDNKQCEQFYTCYRAQAIASSNWQSYAEFVPDENGVCKYYWPIKGCTKNS